MLQKKSVLIVLLAAGLLLLLWPRSSGSGTAGKNEDVSTTEEKRLCAVLSKIDGIGEVYALLSEASIPGRWSSVPAQGRRIYGSASYRP